MKRIIQTLPLVSAILCCCAATVAAELRVLCSTSDLAYFAQEIGGDLVTVDVIADPSRDPHFVEVRPSYMMKARKADVILTVGLELDLWMQSIVDGSRNNHALVIDCSEQIKPVEIPQGKIDASRGDLHRYGNPHYWMDPHNVRPLVAVITGALCGVDSEGAETYRTNQVRIVAEVDSTIRELQPVIDSLSGAKIVYYHNAWPYFNAFTGIEAVGFVEPYPGVAPSPSHVKELIELIRVDSVRVIAVDVYFDDRVPQRIASETGAHVVTVYPSRAARNPGESYCEWLSSNVRALSGALQ